jgi:hypothetical protein
MSWDTLNRAMELLRHPEEMEKKAGVLSALGSSAKAGAKALEAASKAGSKHLTEKGHKNLAALARVAPYAAAGGAGLAAKKKVEQSPTYQKARYKVRLALHKRRIRKAREAAMRQQGYY